MEKQSRESQKLRRSYKKCKGCRKSTASCEVILPSEPISSVLAGCMRLSSADAEVTVSTGPVFAGIICDPH